VSRHQLIFRFLKSLFSLLNLSIFFFLLKQMLSHRFCHILSNLWISLSNSLSLLWIIIWTYCNNSIAKLWRPKFTNSCWTCGLMRSYETCWIFFTTKLAFLFFVRAYPWMIVEFSYFLWKATKIAKKSLLLLRRSWLGWRANNVVRNNAVRNNDIFSV
jgi:hypothetical protein